jgi:CheY-like chemotaxis protein
MPLILLVDDSKTMRLVLRTHLAGMECDFVEAESGRGALDLLAGPDSIDLVISDVRMDDIDGIELVRAIRQREDFGTRVGVVLISGEHSGTVRARSFLAGADDFLEKPIDPYQLRRLVKELLATPPASGEAG